MASVEANQMLAAAAAACEDKKAEDIRILALDPAESGLTDYFLICTGTNDRQTVAITDEIELRLKREFGTYPNSVEGRRQGEWILMDYVDFIVHVFLPEKRAFYGLENLRRSATTLSVDQLDDEIKSAIAQHRPAKPASRTKTRQASSPEEATTPAAGKKSATKKAVGKKTLPGGKPAKKAAGKSAAKRPTPRELAAGSAPGAKAKKSPAKISARPAAKPATKSVTKVAAKSATKKSTTSRAAAKKTVRKRASGA